MSSEYETLKTKYDAVVAERDGLNEYSTKLQDMLSLTQHERDALKAELAEARDRWDYFEKAWKQYSALYSDAISERDALRSACEMLAGALTDIRSYNFKEPYASQFVDKALAQYEALKRQLAGEK